MTAQKPPLFTFRFLALCLFMFLAYCNISVFYSLYLYLAEIGVPQHLRGLIISGSALSTILCFLFASPSLTEKRAPWCIFAGIVLLIGCGVGYLFERDAPGLLLLRLLNGAGVYLLSASAMTLLVAHIPPERSGQAFGIYSVAALLPYSMVPSAFDHLGALLPSPAHGYALMSLALVPAAGINLLLLRQKGAAQGPPAADTLGLRAMFANMRSPRIGLLLLVNAAYYLNFATLFFLSKGLFAERGLGGVGLFFSIQTALMIVIRLCAARLFDEVDKLRLIMACYGLTALGFGLLALAGEPWQATAAALVLGLGMGVGPPSLNARMYAISEPRLKAVNSNLMVMSLQAGNFLGPILGGASVGLLGYGGFLALGTGMSLCALGLCLRLRRL